MQKKIDLGYGNPGFLQEQWGTQLNLKNLDSKPLMPYGHGKKIMPDLEEVIKELHLKHKNVQINKNTKIVLTVGAVQALQAGLAYYKNQEKNKVFIPHPYWGRFQDFINLHNLQVVNKEDLSDFSLITSPNNPNGHDLSHLKADIRDACYNWPHYSKEVKLYTDPLVLFSLSKLSGHSSTRIGWIVCESEEMSKYLKNYVNTFTSGVSIESQAQALVIIKELLNKPAFFNNSYNLLNSRLETLNNLIKEKNLPITVLSSQGMFWYINTTKEIIEKLNIICSKSEDFFDSQANNYRLNLGVEEDIFKELVSRIKLL